MAYAESNYEEAILEFFEELGYNRILGYDINHDYYNPLFMDELEISLQRINPTLPFVAIEEAVGKLQHFENGSLLQKNRVFMDYLQNGLPVSYYHAGEQKTSIVYLVDYNEVENNTFTVANQWTIIEQQEHRPDVLVFLNGMPVVVFELKSPSREETDASDAYLQLKTYQKNIPILFNYNAFNVMSDMAISKAGTITAGEDRFMEWKTKDGSYENTQYAQFDTFIEGMFDKKRFLDILKNFICFSEDAKILSAYHQYFAVRKAADSTFSATKGDGRGGVFWHTQGSGKSLSMVFYAHLLQKVLESPTIVVITDRNDLDDQLFSQFSKCSDFLRQKPIQAESRENLKDLLAGRVANGIIFTTMQKFEETDEALSDRRNIVVMADEAHRGQYGLEEKVGPDGKIRIGTARIIRDQLPNATYIGFTGTPISSKDKSTTEVFGNYIDVYDMTQAVEDGATRPVYYESRVIHLKLDDSVLKLIDDEYEVLAEQAEEHAIEKSMKELGKLDSILGADTTINALVDDIISHYEENRENELTGKAMVVAYSRPIAMKIYKTMLEKRPLWKDKVGVVMTSGNNDPEEWHDIIGNKRHKEEMAKRFKDNDDSFKIAIVVDMWLTGFDVPSLATMYVYKPMQGHNLMQAIARVNRVYKDKEGGLVVDYVGIASALKQAMNDYTKRDKGNFGDTDIAKTAYPKFVEKLEVCRDMFFGFDYSKFMDDSATDLVRAKTISGGVNFITGVKEEKHKETFIKESMLLRQALQLCRSLLTPEERFEAAYFEAVRTLLTRVTGNSKPLSLKEINARINELLKASIKSEGVINLFSDVDTGFSLFDPKFLDEIARMKEKNLAVELLKKLIAEQVALYKHTNLVKSEKFSEKLGRAMKAYLNGMLSNEEVIQELMKMAKEMASASEEANSLGLTDEEIAFYDALTKPAAIKDAYENDQLVALTHELTEMLRKSRTIDWQQKESARARMRMMVKRLLKKYNYPPEGEEEAMKTVISQCEMWTDTGAEYFDVHAVKPAYQQDLAMVAEDKAEYKTDK
ncbi:type I restriction endonuclease subunit R [Enterococcus faecalis]|uniref:type I restriction endonuclease subunit R n=4 Tax=Enterococcus faecalis TaxID=1351 RepID=UPI00115D1DA9|nr:type I restriction endonuclease subunit R [Enterococcus faecalis]